MPKMHRIFLRIALAVALLLSPPAVAGAQVAGRRYVPSVRNAENAVDEAYLRGSVEFLSDTLCQGRASGTPGISEAASWIARQLRQYGVKPLNGSYFQSFTIDSARVGHNVVGLLPAGQKSFGDRHFIIIGAHFDNLGILGGALYPGADSNASGVVAMTAMARMFSYMVSLGKSYGRDVLFVAFDANHISMKGSEAFYAELDAGRLLDGEGRALRPSDAVLMVNMAQIGGTLAPVHKGRGDYLLMLSGDNTHFASSLRSVNSRFGMDIAYDYYGSRDFTRVFYYRIGDQKVFVDHKVPSVLLTSGITMLSNRQGDTPDTLDYEVLRQRIILIFNWIDRYI